MGNKEPNICLCMWALLSFSSCPEFFLTELTVLSPKENVQFSFLETPEVGIIGIFL